MSSSERIHSLEFDQWAPQVGAERSDALCRELEHGAILFFPRLRFELLPAELSLLSGACASDRNKNISLRAGAAEVRGAHAPAADLAHMRDLMSRYAAASARLVDTLVPRYAPHRRPGSTSFRPCRIDERKLSWRRDDTRMHIDAFPSNPVQGRRILRVFSNIHPAAGVRTWLVGEPFPLFARRFVKRTRAQQPGAAWLLDTLGITKSRRSEYDHRMLQLHDRAKADTAYQREGPRLQFPFPAGSTWIAFTDQVVHAALNGQYALEQTFYLELAGMRDRQTAPLAVLEELTGANLA
jgi:3-deoxy-D-manno-octulosonic acid hydroxylase-like protein